MSVPIQQTGVNWQNNDACGSKRDLSRLRAAPSTPLQPALRTRRPCSLLYISEHIRKEKNKSEQLCTLVFKRAHSNSEEYGL